MKQILKTGIILFLICAVSAGLCGVINSITAPIIEENLIRERNAALSVVALDYQVGNEIPLDDGRANIAYTMQDNGEDVGYIFELTGSGYGGQLTIIASYLNSGELVSAKLTANSETPGLGKEAENDWYMDMFKGLGGSSPLPATTADLSSEDAAVVSGASVTFGGVAAALRNGSELAKSLGGGV